MMSADWSVGPRIVVTGDSSVRIHEYIAALVSFSDLLVFCILYSFMAFGYYVQYRVSLSLIEKRKNYKKDRKTV